MDDPGFCDPLGPLFRLGKVTTAAVLAARFKGVWRIERHILDLDSQWLGRFDGEGVFVPDDAGLRYTEEGQLQFGGLTAMKATRCYLWRFPGRAEVEVLFEDARPFHSFTFQPGRVEASHFCDPDQYDVAYEFSNWPLWRAEWRVEGPRKDYRMVSHYRPAEGL